VNPNETTRDVPPITFRAAIAPGSIDAEARTVEVVWSTGARVLRGFFDRYYEELSLDPRHVKLGRLNGGAPLLDAHNAYGVASVLGVVEPGSARTDGKRGTAKVRFARAEDDPGAETVWRKVQDGILTAISVGYRTHKAEKITGGDGQIPVFRATDWEPFELSVVPMGADAGAGFRADAAPERCVFVVPPEETRMDPEQTASATPAEEAPRGEARGGEAPGGEALARQAAEAATRSERERAHAIQLVVRRARLEETVADDLIARGVSLDAARAAVLDRLAEADAQQGGNENHVRVEAGEDVTDKFQRGAAAWLFQKSGVAGVIREAAKTSLAAEAFRGLEFDPGEFRGMTFTDLARAALELRGQKARGLDKLAIVGKALTYRDGSGSNSTSDFAILLESVLNKTLLGGYATTPDTWPRFCAVRAASDFRAQNFYRNGSFGTLDALNEHGEFQNKPIPDGEKTSLTIGTKGNIISITRQAIVNDDMGAFTDLAVRFGRSARLSIEVDVYALISLNSGLGPTMGDAQPFFHTNRKNVNATGSALGVAGLDADRVVMAIQRDPSGNEILDLRPAVLIVPIGLGGAARVTNTSVYDVDAVAASATNKFMVPNKVVGLFRDIIDTPRLSGTRRYLLAEPAISPVFVVAFLDGNQTPYLEPQLGWRVDGMEWKLRLDYGVAAIDWRGAVTNAGV